MEDLIPYLTVLGLSMVPVIELRGAIVAGMAMGLPLDLVLATAIVGNMLPVPFILLFIRRVFGWMKKKSGRMRRLAQWLEEHAGKKAGVVYKYEVWGLMIFVAIPLPGTGAWTGALIAALLDIRLRVAIPVIFAGVVIAGIAVTALSYGVGALF